MERDGKRNELEPTVTGVAQLHVWSRSSKPILLTTLDLKPYNARTPEHYYNPRWDRHGDDETQTLKPQSDARDYSECYLVLPTLLFLGVASLSLHRIDQTRVMIKKPAPSQPCSPYSRDWSSRRPP